MRNLFAYVAYRRRTFVFSSGIFIGIAGSLAFERAKFFGVLRHGYKRLAVFCYICYISYIYYIGYKGDDGDNHNILGIGHILGA